METAEASIAGAAGTSVTAADKIGNALLDTAGKSEFSGTEMAKAYAEVAGQLKATEGHALSAGEATGVMTAASNLAEAKQIGLGEATSTVAKTMQAFQLPTTQAAHVTDVLFNASNATGQSVEGLATQLTKVKSKLGEMAPSVGQLSGLLVDMTDHGVTGRAAMTGLNTGLNTLLKGADGVTTAVKSQNTAYESMTPQLKHLADEYKSGAISATAFKKEAGELAPAQAGLAESFAKGATAVQTAQLKQKELGVTVFDSAGKFVGMGSVIDQLYPKFQKMSQQQQLTTASTLFGAGAARQMMTVIDAGPAAYNKATASVERHGAAESAAKKQSETLHGELKTLEATLVDLGTKIGVVLIPVVTTFAGVLLKIIPTVGAVVDFIKSHWVLVGTILLGPIVPTIAAFTVWKSKLESIFTEIVSWIKNAWHTVETDTSHLVGSIVSFFTSLPGKVISPLKAIPGDIVQLWDKVEGGVSTLMTNIGKFFSELPSHIIGDLKALPGDMLHLGEELGEELVKGVEKFAEKIEHAITNPVEEAVKAIESLNPFGGGGGSSPTTGGATAGVTGTTQATGTSAGMVKALEASGLSANAAQVIVAAYGAEGGTNTAEDPKEGAYGKAQWVGSRKTALGQFAASKHEPISSEKAQLEFTAKEIKERGETGELNKAKSPKEAADLFIKSFEHPASPATVEGRVNASSRPAAAKHTEATTKNTAAVEHNTAAHTKAKGTKAEASLPGGVTTAGEATTSTGAVTKAGVAKEVAQQKQALADWVAKMQAEAKNGSKDQKAAIAQEIADRKAYIARLIADEKAGLTVTQAAQKEKAKAEVALKSSGEKELTKLQGALTSGSLATLNKTLTATHERALAAIEGKLVGTHKAALEKLDAELGKTWKEAEAKKASDERTERATAEADAATANREAYEAKEAADQKIREEYISLEAAQITKNTTLATDQSDAVVQGIQDSTKVALDKQAEVGLTGTAEIAARLQTVLDEVTGEQNQAVDAAKLAADNAQGTGAISEAQAAAHLAEVESNAKRLEAEAQAKEEIAKGTVSTAAGATPGPSITLNLYGNANMTSTEWMTEVGWTLKTGELPAPTPTALPA
jgi:hypothetical protein